MFRVETLDTLNPVPGLLSSMTTLSEPNASTTPTCLREVSLKAEHPMLSNTRIHFGLPNGALFQPSHEWLKNLRDEAPGTRCTVEAFAGKAGVGKLIAWDGSMYAEMSVFGADEGLRIDLGWHIFAGEVVERTGYFPRVALSDIWVLPPPPLPRALSPNPHEEALCVNCGSEEHDIRDCPHPEDPHVRNCVFCERVGHYNEDCPLANAPSRRVLNASIIPTLTMASFERYERLHACFQNVDSQGLALIDLDLVW